MQPTREYVKPPNQLRLSEDELAEELACTLTSGNPTAPSNIARFIPKDNAFKVCTSSTIACLETQHQHAVSTHLTSTYHLDKRRDIMIRRIQSSL